MKNKKEQVIASLSQKLEISGLNYVSTKRFCRDEL